MAYLLPALHLQPLGTSIHWHEYAACTDLGLQPSVALVSSAMAYWSLTRKGSSLQKHLLISPCGCCRVHTQHAKWGDEEGLGCHWYTDSNDAKVQDSIAVARSLTELRTSCTYCASEILCDLLFQLLLMICQV